MVKSSNSSNGEGNTKPPPVSKEITKKQVSPCKKWVFTLNNYTKEEEDLFRSIVPEISSLYHIGYEVGQSGTPHLQGFIVFKSKCRPSSHKLSNRIHWEKMKGTTQQSIDYCTKEGKTMMSAGIPKPVFVYPMELEWQKDILKEIGEEPDDRVINWIWSQGGGTRKTSTCKYLAVKHKAVVLGGKAADVRNGICTHLQKHGETPGLVVINIPKSFCADFVSYEAFENIKDMCFYSGKYEGGMVVGNSPHLYVFANFAPDESKMTSEGRWNVVNIDEKNEEIDFSIDGGL